jgi:hypothetical protein
MTANNCNDFRDLALSESVILRELDLRREPEFRLAVSGCHVHVKA